MTGFNNPVVGGSGGDLVREAIKSPNYAAGTAGWSINQDGSAEFNDVTIRGSLTLSDVYTTQLSFTVTNAPFNVTGSYVEWASGPFPPIIGPTPPSLNIDCRIMFIGRNTNTAASAIYAGRNVYTGPTATGPWTLFEASDDSTSAIAVVGVAGSTALPQAYNARLIGELDNIYYKIVPTWKISSGSAATATFVSGTPQMEIIPSLVGQSLA